MVEREGEREKIEREQSRTKPGAAAFTPLSLPDCQPSAICSPLNGFSSGASAFKSERDYRCTFLVFLLSVSHLVFAYNVKTPFNYPLIRKLP